MWQLADIHVHVSLEVLFTCIVHAGNSAVTTVTVKSYTLFPSPRLFYVLLSSSMMGYACTQGKR